MDSRKARRTAVAALVAAAGVLLGADAAAAEPDLRISRVSNPPSTIGTNGSFTVADRVLNGGDSSARGSTTRYYVTRSLQFQLQEANGLRGGRSVGSLGAGDSSPGTRMVSVPNGTPPGRYYLAACADARRRVAEEDEGNNCRVSRTRVRIVTNRVPTVDSSAAAVTVVEDAGPMLLDAGFTISDDLINQAFGGLNRATLSLTGDLGRDWFFYAPQRGITGTYDTGTGVLTLTGTASVADYQSALRSVWYGNSDDAPPAARMVEVRVRDRLGAWSAPERRSVLITPVNDAPALAFAGPPDEKHAIGSRIALADPDSGIAGATVRVVGWGASEIDLKVVNQLGITGTYDSGTGVLTLTGTASVSDYQSALRSVTYTNISASGPGRFDFQVTDAQGTTSNILPYVEQQP